MLHYIFYIHIPILLYTVSITNTNLILVFLKRSEEKYESMRTQQDNENCIMGSVIMSSLDQLFVSLGD